MNWEAGPKDAPRHRVTFEACLIRYLRVRLDPLVYSDSHLVVPVQ